MRFKILSFEQPIGEFVLTVMSVADILRISYIDTREFDQISLDSKGGPQREASTTRINEIARYSETPDATFPTPILLALPENKYILENDYIEIQESSVASVVDGQHRLLGLAKSKFKNDYVLPVVFVLDATDEQKALIFTIINGKQTRVSGSVIYDLFNVIEGRNPFKTAHEIARALNSNQESPFYRRLKMLGKKSVGSNETLSQGTFITHLIKHISTNPAEDFNLSRSQETLPIHPNAVLNRYFIEGKDEVIYKIIFNLFQAVKNTFREEWEDPERFILSKTTGYTGVMKAFTELYKNGQERKDLTYDFFKVIFERLKLILSIQELRLISSDFPPNNSGESKLRDKIIEALNESFPKQLGFL
jgi:DGQHR domain-containing protein